MLYQRNEIVLKDYVYSDYGFPNADSEVRRQEKEVFAKIFPAKLTKIIGALAGIEEKFCGHL